MKLFYISCNRFTCGVITDENNKIIQTAPILKKFKGQYLTNLFKFCKNMNAEIKEIKDRKNEGT